MAFLDEEKELAPPEVPDAPRRPEDRRRRRQQYRLRRLLGVGVAVAFLILVVLAFRGCLEARKERSIQNYTQDVSTIMTESEQSGKQFFQLLEDPSGSSPQEFEDNIRLIRGAAESLLNRADALDVPGEMSDAQTAVKLSLKLRRDALEKIADSVGPATANAETASAVQTITNQMSSLYSSDVLYVQEAAPEIKDVADQEGVTTAPLSGGNFMPDPDPTAQQNIDWLSQTKVLESLSGVSGASDLTSGTHGLGLVQVDLGGTTLSPDTTNSVAANDRELAVQVQNQGTTEESDVSVVVTVNGTQQPSVSVPQIGPGETQTAKIQLSAVPADGSDVSISVLVQPVAGESVTDNNEASYTVTFS